MFQKEELFKLLDAGFSKDEIMKMVNPGESEESQEGDDAGSETDTDAGNSDSDQNLDSIINDHVDKAFSKLNEAVAEFNKKLESFNVMNAEMSSQMQNEKKSIEDILKATILMPDGSEMKKGE